MSKTAKFWLIANLSWLLALAGALAIVLASLLANSDLTQPVAESKDYWVTVFGLVFGLLLYGVPSVRVGESIVYYVLTLGLSVLVIAILLNIGGFATASVLLTVPAVFLVLSLAAAAAMVGFVNANVGEIISWSMRYRRTKVDLLEYKWKYLTIFFLDVSRSMFGFAFIIFMSLLFLVR